MQSTPKRHTKASKWLSLVFLYLPFLLMQLSYKFFIVANLYFYVHHHSKVLLQVDLSHEIQSTAKKTAHEKAYYYITHLSIDKRYSHKVFSNNDAVCDNASVTAPKPVCITIKRQYYTANTDVVLFCHLSSASRGPPCA
ncbi:MAG: hypothetical protein QM726_03670 [Chitinophagaceae bacterium]